MFFHNVIVFLITIYRVADSRVISPCPEVFQYESKNSSENRWYGVLTLSTEDDLEGVWIKMSFDRELELIGNWFSEATTEDNILYSIAKPEYKFLAGPPILIRFFVQYNSDDGVPNIKKILLNGKTICPKPNITFTGPTLHISQGNLRNNKVETSTTNRPYRTSTRKSSEENRHVSTRESSNEIKCGTVENRPSPLITHGQPASPGQWPWHVALYLFGTELKYICGGTLISDKYVLTAAHCVTKPGSEVPVKKSSLVIYLGKYNLIRFGSEVQEKETESIIVHPEYNSSVFVNDIALLRLDSSAVFNDYVRPCCLWKERDSTFDRLTGQSGIVVGFGFNENGLLSKDLLHAELPVISTSTCLSVNRKFVSQIANDNNFCVGYRNDTFVCYGDSGGGMVFPKTGSSSRNKVWQLRGIVSVAIPRQGEAICDSKQYSIFTDVAKYVGWIEKQIKNYE